MAEFTYPLAIRKGPHFENFPNWLSIIIKYDSMRDRSDTSHEKNHFFAERTCSFFYPILNLPNSAAWEILILLTIMMNTVQTIYTITMGEDPKISTILLVHILCLFYWINFILIIIHQKVKLPEAIHIKRRKRKYLILDGISLLPLSIIYLIIEPSFNPGTFFVTRMITILRMYRIPEYFKHATNTAGTEHWMVFLLEYVFYYFLAIHILASMWVMVSDTEKKIHDSKDTNEKKFYVGLYFTLVTMLNVGFGDIVGDSNAEMIVCIFSMLIGFALTTAVLIGALTSEITNKEYRRETYRHEYSATMQELQEAQISDETVSKILDHHVTIWETRRAVMDLSKFMILPISMHKEISFDITFEHFSKSLLFSKQKRSFLRSVALIMKNKTYLPGDVIVPPYGLGETMYCITSGVIEILSEENDDTPILSLENGTCIGEASLFHSVPKKTTIRAATYVDFQVLEKKDFCKLAIKYPDTYRTMYNEILIRIEMSKQVEPEHPIKTLDEDFIDYSRRRTVKQLIEGLKKNEKNRRKPFTRFNFLNLYTLSENIPKVKTVPLNLVKSRPWILRPNTLFSTIWYVIVMTAVMTVAFVYPYLTGYVREVGYWTWVMTLIVDAVYITDIYVQCTTAVLREDNFTYETNMKNIILLKLKTVGFYLDIIASYNLSLFYISDSKEQNDSMYFLYSLNRLLKSWVIPVFFYKLENNLKLNLLIVRTFKYVLYVILLIHWCAVLLYLVACPGEECMENRWFFQTQLEEVKTLDPTPNTEWRSVLSTYFAVMACTTLGYGDVTPRSIADLNALVFCMFFGVILVGYCLAEASSTFKHKGRIRSEYQEDVFAVDKFMSEHEIPKELHRRVQDYFRLQWNYDHGYLMKEILKGDRFPYQQKQVMLIERINIFKSVPLFQDASHSFIKVLAEQCKLKVLPHNEIIMHAGTLTKEMYILLDGYCEISSGSEGSSISVIGPMTPFGDLEMIQGTLLTLNVRTLTHVKIICIDYNAYLRAVTVFPAARENIENVIEKEHQKKIKNLTDRKNEHRIAILQEDNDPEENREIIFFSRSFINVYKLNQNQGKSYWKPFDSWKKLKLLKFLFLPFVILPDSPFLKIWVFFRVVISFLLGMIAPIYSTFFNQSFWLIIMGNLLIFVSLIDMYVMFHVGYYNKKGLLMHHPAKTPAHYFKGSFFLDLITAFPIIAFNEAAFPAIQESSLMIWKAPGLLKVLQFYKFLQACEYLESDILKSTDKIRLIKFLPTTLIVINLLTGFLILIECDDEKIASYQSKPLLQELLHFTNIHCRRNGHIDKNYTDHPKYDDAFRFYIIVYYWTTATITGVGFGDITAHNHVTMITCIVIVLLGIFFFGYMIASIISSKITLHSPSLKYYRRIKELMEFMTHEKVDEHTQNRIVKHYIYNWKRTGGSNPQEVLSYVYTALMEDIVVSMYEPTLRKVPLFADVNESFFRVIGKYLQEMYFIRGETIVRYHDVQDYVNIIYRGQVDVVSKHGHKITSMGKGGMFGNLKMTPYFLSQISVFAIKNVDILRITSERLNFVLQNYPAITAKSKELGLEENDFVPSLEQLPKVETEDDQNFQYPLQDLEDSPSRTKRVSQDSEDSEDVVHPKLPPVQKYYFKKGILKLPDSSLLSFVILPDSWLATVLGTSVLLATCLSCTLTTYYFAFQDFSNGILVIGYLIDIFFLVKIYLEFHSSFFDKYGDYVIKMEKIKRRYIQNKEKLVFDVISNIPLDWIALTAPESLKFPTLSIVRLNRILRMQCIFDYYATRSNSLMVNKIFLELSRMIVWVTLLIHFIACMWYMIACPFSQCYENSWVQKRYSNKNATKWEIYVISLYYTVTVATTTGYGDIETERTAEMIFSIVMMILSRFGVVLVAGALTAVLNAHSQDLFRYIEIITDLRMNLVHQRASEYQVKKMWRYVSSLWLKESFREIPYFISTMPYVMQCDIMYAMYGHHLYKSFIFSNTNNAFLRQLTIYFKRFIFFPGNYILQQGDIDDTMYLIHKGEVNAMTIHSDLMETIHYTLKENDHFGIIQGLKTGTPHQFSFRAKTEAEILTLSLNHWQHLLKYFPEVKQLIYARLQDI